MDKQIQEEEEISRFQRFLQNHPKLQNSYENSKLFLKRKSSESGDAIKQGMNKTWFFTRENIIPYLAPLAFIFLFAYYIFIFPFVKLFSWLYKTLLPPKIRNIIRKISLIILAGFFTFVSVIGRILLVIYDILVPTGLRELVPLLQLYRKYVLVASNILSGEKSQEIMEVSEELDELMLKEQKMIKNYPIRRGVGEVINLAVTPLVFIAIPTLVVRILRIGYATIFYTFDLLPTLGPLGSPNYLQYLDLLRLIENLTGLGPIYSMALFGTGLLLASWIATIFGPIYAVFHNCHVILMRYGGYRWANIYRSLENIFSLPYHAAKSTFSFFDAPPISAETYKDFKLEIVDEVDTIKNKVQALLILDTKKVPNRSKEMLEDLLGKAELTLNEIDISRIEQETARTFALLIWSKEASIVPWISNEAKIRFARENEMTVDEVRKSFRVILRKIDEGYLTDDLFSSVLITGALKGINAQQKKYKQLVDDIEYNKLAISLALGARQYLKDQFTKKPWYKKLGKKILISLIAPFMPIGVIIIAFYNYFKHIIISTLQAIIALGTTRVGKFIARRFLEIRDTIISTFNNVSARGKEFSFKEDLNIDFTKYLKIFGKLLIKVILVVPLLLRSLFRTLKRLVSRIWIRRSEEERMKKMFEQDLATASLIAMYQEIYDKMLISDLLITD
ncbi:MAG: hypothetical protein ACTSQF_05590 [Candidatus Heimdallarchaeaceae archaeon]